MFLILSAPDLEDRERVVADLYAADVDLCACRMYDFFNYVAITPRALVGVALNRVVRSALGAFGRLDIVVNNAGATHRNRPMLEVTEEEFDRVYAVNVKSLFLTAKNAVPHFRKAGGGCFVTIASTAGVRPRPGLTWYNGSKGAAIVTSRSMAAELGPDKIRVNVINPVIGETGLLEMFMGMPDTPENRKKFVATIPLGRMSKPADIANAALFLASDEAEFVTGVCLEVDGGRCV